MLGRDGIGVRSDHPSLCSARARRLNPTPSYSTGCGRPSTFLQQKGEVLFHQFHPSLTSGHTLLSSLAPALANHLLEPSQLTSLEEN